MPNNKVAPLAGVRVMVTRPAHQAGQLIQLIEQAGAEAYCFPLLEIVPLSEPEAAIALVKRLDDFDIAIFISQNAVSHGLDLINRYARLPDHLKLATVGLGSAKLLEKRARAADIMPQDIYNSETLLAMPALQTMQGKRVVIFRGVGGRNLLARTLRERGAEVHYAEVYQRQCPNADIGQLAQDWQQHPMDYISITSAESLKNLVTLCHKGGNILTNKLLKAQLVMVNQRLAELAEHYHFKLPPLLASKASDEALLAAMIE